jgi:predicted DNA-binding protein with PD1-like motif
LKRCNLHYVKTSKFPPENSYYTIEKPLEIASISGLIADYEPRLHIAVGCEDKETYIGHLEKDSIVLYLAEVLIMRLDNMVMKREIDPEYNIPFLKEGI